MAKRKQLYEGKAKIIFEGPEADTLVQYFKDDATAFNAQKKDVIKGKGVLNNYISEHIMTAVGDLGIPNHFIARLSDREQLIRKLEIIPIEVLVRNYFAGSLSKKFGVKEGTPLNDTLIEYCLKSDELGDPHISSEHILNIGLCSFDELELIDEYSLRINDILRGIFYSIGINLIDFKLEFGICKKTKEVILADEISPDTCRLWDLKTNKKLDKDRFRRDLGDVEGAYQEVLERLNIKS